MNVKVIKGKNQIGGCITKIECKNTGIIIDFGEELDDTKEEFELEGLTYGSAKYDAVFITHSHSDHIGLINKIMKDIPVYVEEKSLIIHNLTCDFCSKDTLKRDVNTFKIQKYTDNIKPIFDNGDLKVTPYITDHSSYNSCMFLIEGDGKKILHTGDYRGHGRKKDLFYNSLERIGNVDLLITEGTTLSRNTKKYVEEKDIEKVAKDIMDKYEQVFIMQSSTNIDRTVSFVRAALESNKKFVLDLFSYYLNKYINFNINVDYKNIFVWKPLKYRKKPEWFKEKYLNINTSSNIMPYYAMQVKASMLDDIKMLYNKGMIKKACLIYSMWDGYIKNEENLQDFIKELKDMNIDFIELHTSGHADVETMENLNKIINPKCTIIIHTENNDGGIDIFNNVVDLKDDEDFYL